ncbi:MAG TPA: L,D-transpeptidase [Candidatus Sulfotelmatobacter sp.]|nr:L,D-transpeptidase [Candidatus Sulfotelmatobacter sp.]
MKRMATAAGKAAKTVVEVVFAIALVVPAWTQDSADKDNDQSDQDDSGRVVLVSLVDRQLAVIEDGEVIATFSIAVGADLTPSPTGEFKVVNRVQNPTYYHPGTVIPAGKNNPLGTRWLGLSQKGYGIHGTNAPISIGRAASHGCIRLRNRDVEKLFTMLRVGDTVKIRGVRDEETAQIFGKPNDALVAEASTATAAGGQ